MRGTQSLESHIASNDKVVLKGECVCIFHFKLVCLAPFYATSLSMP